MNRATSHKQSSVGRVEKQYYTFAQPPEKLILESGAELGPVTVAYETYGTLSKEKDNCILLAHAFSVPYTLYLISTGSVD